MIISYHRPTFRGRHNQNRARVLLVLENLRLGNLGPSNTALTVKELAKLTGCSESSLSASMNKWCKWRFLKRKLDISPSGRKQYLYRIAPRGTRWFRRWCLYMPRLREWTNEIRPNVNRWRLEHSI